jgi:hypothetical protein
MPTQLATIRSTFRPTPTQDRFLADRTPLKLLCGGLGSGKTRTGAEAFYRVVRSNPPGTHTMMVAPTLPMFHRFMQPAWEQACPRGDILQHHKAQRYYRLTGNRVVWYAGATDPSALEGANLCGFWGDEIRYWPVESWRNLNARRRDPRARRLQGILTSTPAMGWMEEQFNRGLPGRVRLSISTLENAAHLAPGYIDDLRRTYSARQCRSLIDGEFSVVEGQVYEAFDERRHAVDWGVDPSCRTLVWLDFGVRRASVLFAQETGPYAVTVGDVTLPPHALVVFDELHPDQCPTERLIPLVQRRLLEHGLAEADGTPHVDAVYCDPAGRARDIASGLPSIHLLQAAFGPVVRYLTDARWTWIPNGIALVEGALNPLHGAPLLYVDRRLLTPARTRDSSGDRGLVPSLRGYRYPPDGGEHPLKDGFYEHAMDALRYGVMNALAARGRPAPEVVGIRHG